MQKIIVRNFRQITNAEIEIKEFLFLIGEQASGKSTLAKLIYFFKSLKEDYFNLIYENANRTDENLENIFIKKIQDKFNIYFGYTTDLDKNFEIIFYYNYVSPDSNENRNLTLSKAKSLQLQLKFNYEYIGDIINNTKELAQTINNFTEEQTKTNENNYIVIERTKSKFIKELTDRVNNLFYDNYSPMFIPAGRNITVSYPEQFQTLFFGNLFTVNSHERISKSVDLVLMKAFILHSKFLNDYFRGSNFEDKIKHNSEEHVSNNILTFFKEHAEYILQGKYENFEGNEKIIYDKKGHKFIPLNIASSGQQESIRIIQDLFYLLFEKQKSFRIIEEPEAHLYPLAQKELIELISLIVNKTQSQIVITTHSPYILSILNNLLMYSVVIQKKPDTKKNITTHFGTQDLKNKKDERINLTYQQVQAYVLDVNSSNYCTSIIDEETKLIGENYLDAVTEELNNDFNVLYHLNFQNQNNA